MKCWMIPQQEHPPVFIQLGRFGDLILLFPAFREIHRRTGQKPIVIVSVDYASVFDGITYAIPWKVHYHWWEGMPAAIKLAQQYYGNAIIPAWWTEFNPEIVKGPTVLQCHGAQWGIDTNKWPSFMHSMWDRAGFSRYEMMRLPLVFDNRNHEAEQRLLSLLHRKSKPLLLVNWAGQSSPFAFVPELMSRVWKFKGDFDIVDLSKVKARRLYDLLGLFDAAVGLITIDTATLHLAHGSKVPYVAYIVDGWSGSTPRGNCVLDIRYKDTLQRINELETVLDQWRHGNNPRLQPIPDLRPGNIETPTGGARNLEAPAVA